MRQIALSMLTALTVLLTIILFATSNILLAAPKTLSSVDRIEACAANVKKSLKISTKQEDMWDNLVNVMRENAEEMDELIKARADKTKTMNAVDDLKSYSEILDAHAEGMKKSIPPFEKLYTSMSDEQKEDADVLFKCYWNGKYGKTAKK
jgi:hypothetical protein